MYCIYFIYLPKSIIIEEIEMISLEIGLTYIVFSWRKIEKLGGGGNIINFPCLIYFFNERKRGEGKGNAGFGSPPILENLEGVKKTLNILMTFT